MHVVAGVGCIDGVLDVRAVGVVSGVRDGGGTEQSGIEIVCCCSRSAVLFVSFAVIVFVGIVMAVSICLLFSSFLSFLTMLASA